MISDFGKNKIAQDYSDLIAKIKINSNVMIETFDIKVVENDTLTIEFIVPNGITQITKIETADIDNNILAVSNLFVSISNDTKFKYQVKVGN